MPRIFKLAFASLTFVVLSLIAALPAQADPVFFGPTPYTSSANSPFNSLTFTYFHLENFEDGALNTPGVTGNGTVADPGGITDSVDADDGTIDGSGTNGRSYFLSGSASTGITFTFNAGTLGSLPTHVGVVWTDGFNPIIFEAFGAGGASLGTVTGNHADSSFFGTTGEDRFYGVFSSGGILSITIRSPSGGGIEVDHLQYGLATTTTPPPSAVPEPATMLLLGTGLAGVAAKVRRRRTSGNRD